MDLSSKFFVQQEREKQLREWWKRLRMECDQLIVAEGEPKLAISPSFTARALALLLAAVERTEVEREVCYLALDLYIRFIPKHVASVMEIVSMKEAYCDSNSTNRQHSEETRSKEDEHSGNSRGNAGKRRAVAELENRSLKTRPQVPDECAEKLLQKVVERLCQQTPLRVLSCLQIACKMSSYYEVLSSNDIKKILQELGCHYSRTSIARSEARVLKELDYRCSFPSSHLHYLGLLLDLLHCTITSFTACVSSETYHWTCLSPRSLALKKPPVESSINCSRVFDALSNPSPTCDPQKARTGFDLCGKVLKRDERKDSGFDFTEEEKKELAGFAARLQEVYLLSTALLDAVLLNGDSFFRHLLVIVTGQTDLPCSLRSAFRHVERDRVLLVSGLVLQASASVSPKSTGKLLLPLITRLSGVPSGDLLCVVQALLKTLQL